MNEEEFRRLARENPSLLVDALIDVLTTNPEAFLRALMGRPEALARLLILLTALPLAIPTTLLRLLAAPVGPPPCGDFDALRARISDVERRVEELEGRMVRREDLEALIKELMSKYGRG